MAQPARSAGSSGGPGEGLTRRPGQGERKAPPTRRRRAGPRSSGHRHKLRDQRTSLCRRREKGLRMGVAQGGGQCGGAGLPPAAEGGSGAVRLGFAREKCEGAVPAQPPAGTPRRRAGYLQGLFQVVPWSASLGAAISVSDLGKHFRAASELVLFCCKGRGCAASQNLSLRRSSLCKTGNPSFFAKARGGKLQNPLELSMAFAIPWYT